VRRVALLGHALEEVTERELAAVLPLLARHDGDRRRRVEVLAAEARAGDDDGLDRALGLDRDGGRRSGRHLAGRSLGRGLSSRVRRWRRRLGRRLRSGPRWRGRRWRAPLGGGPAGREREEKTHKDCGRGMSECCHKGPLALRWGLYITPSSQLKLFAG